MSETKANRYLTPLIISKTINRPALRRAGSAVSKQKRWSIRSRERAR
jgi:hypothetical protein